MLGLTGRYLLDHEDRRNHCTVRPDTNERVNLQPWYVVVQKEATKTHPAKTLVWRPANEDDMKYFLSLQGNTKDPLIGELPQWLADLKGKMYKDAVAEYERKNSKTPEAAKV